MPRRLPGPGALELCLCMSPPVSYVSAPGSFSTPPPPPPPPPTTPHTRTHTHIPRFPPLQNGCHGEKIHTHTHAGHCARKHTHGRAYGQTHNVNIKSDDLHRGGRDGGRSVGGGNAVPADYTIVNTNRNLLYMCQSSCCSRRRRRRRWRRAG